MKLKHKWFAVAIAAANINANADLAGMGPIDPVINFPSYYQDFPDPNIPIDSLALELCIPDAVELAVGSCLVTADMLKSPTDPITFPDNFPDESFYFNARTLRPLTGLPGVTGNADLRMALEATVTPGPNATLVQSVFTRVRYKFFPPVSGDYTVETPYSIDGPTHYLASNTKPVSETVDIGIACADFSCVLKGSTEPFLRASDAEGGAPAPLYSANGNIYLANPITEVFVTGGPKGNKFKITVVPDGTTTPVVLVNSNKFNLMGRIYNGMVPLPPPKPVKVPVVNPPVIIPASTLTAVDKPTVSISAVDPLASEASGDSGKFMINLNAPSVKAIKVKYSIEGDAAKGKDYQKFSSNMIIPAGSVFGAIDVLPMDDKGQERTEKVTIKLLNKGIKGYSVKGGAVAHVKILDND